MGKKNSLVVLSSSDDEEGEVISFNSKLRLSSSSNKRLKSTSAPPKKPPPRAKRPRLSASFPRSSHYSTDFDEIKRFCKDFDEGSNGFKVSNDRERSNGELWVDKYKPYPLEELAVNKKKVEEVKLWFEERLRILRGKFLNHVLLITGPAGVGKSATVHAIASHLGLAVCEWKTPTPTLWQEHLHNSNSGMGYTSKLNEFENFVEKTRKYKLITSSSTGESQTSSIILIDDLPVVNGRVSYRRLHSCLHSLVQSICIPTVIVITDYSKADAMDYSTHYFEELQSSLQNAGAHKVTFNPITDNSIKKMLLKICKDQQLRISSQQIDLIAKTSGGDIRHAITSLQFFCLKPQMLVSSFPNVTLTYSENLLDETNLVDGGFSLPFRRDETLSLFHALGKFLHNKREAEINISSERDPVFLKERLTRLPLKMDSPEKVLCQVHGQAGSIADFLHENVLDFLTEEATDDAWLVASYLSDADCLLASHNGKLAKNYDAENVIQSAAASVAVRGVLFGNSHPLSARWHAIRRPKLWQVEQLLWNNKAEMVSQRIAGYNGTKLLDLPVILTEYRPALKWLGSRVSDNLEAELALMETGMSDDMQSSDDEIEDW